VTLAYFDTSVLVKNYVTETGSPRARELLARYQFLSSFITPVELISALTRRRSTGELRADEMPPILARVQEDRPYWKLLDVSQAVLNRAEEIIQRTRIRTLDAVHVASLINFQATSDIQVSFVTADARQRDAAKQVGLDVVWVG
jgi:predicted nucleic acid-binding protein